MDNELNKSKSEYSKNWETTSNIYDKYGFYKWCVSKINNCSNILEIGAGVGITSELIIKQNIGLTAIENNEFNFKKLVLRNKKYTYSIINSSSQLNISKNNFVLCDFINDYDIVRKILSSIKIDCIICWFLGTNDFVYKLNNFTPLDYKDIVYDKIFNDTSEYLLKGGIINIIERSEFLSQQIDIDNYINDYTNYYNLKKNGLKIEKFEQLLNNNILTIPGIKMTIFSQESNNNLNKNYGLLSLTIKKL